MDKENSETGRKPNIQEGGNVFDTDHEQERKLKLAMVG